MPEALQRPENWPALLATFIDEHRNSPFVWGQHDCCLFAANWVELCLGFDPAKDFRGQYKDQLTAHKLLKKHKGVRGIADKQFSRVKLNLARRGDLVAYRLDKHKPALVSTALGVLEGACAVFAGPQGLSFIGRGDLMKTAWSIERSLVPKCPR